MTFPLDLAACKLKITNTSKTAAKTLAMYVPNKDSILLSVPAEKVINVTTLSAGETLTYMLQASDGGFTVEVVPGVGD